MKPGILRVCSFIQWEAIGRFEAEGRNGVTVAFQHAVLAAERRIRGGQEGGMRISKLFSLSSHYKSRFSPKCVKKILST